MSHANDGEIKLLIEKVEDDSGVVAVDLQQLLTNCTTQLFKIGAGFVSSEFKEHLPGQRVAVGMKTTRFQAPDIISRSYPASIKENQLLSLDHSSDAAQREPQERHHGDHG